MMALLASAVAAACASDPAPRIGPDPASSEPPALLLGSFEDDYGSRFTISADGWIQHPRSRYTVVRWVPEGRYLVARNHADNPTDGGLWTRIDWVELEGMAPWHWAFCFSSYDADSFEAAESVEPVDRSDPSTGCRGWPFSRMRRTESAHIFRRRLFGGTG